jgi:hypothetical protein
LENLETLGEGNRLEDIEKGGNGGRSDKSHREPTSKSANETETEVNESKERKGKLDIDATINEASDLAEQTEHQRTKEQAAQRKGESLEGEGGGRGDGRGLGSRERMEREKEGRERGKRIVGKNQERFE